MAAASRRDIAPRSTSSGSGKSISLGQGSVSTLSAGVNKKPSRPSDRLNPKTVDPFSSSSKSKTPFAAAYNSGGIPCRLVHGSVKHKLAWNPLPEEVGFDPVLINLAEGIRETVHPYMFVARQGYNELLDVWDAGERATPLLPKLVPPIRAALVDKDASVFEAGLSALVQLSKAVGVSLNLHLKVLLVPIAKRMMERCFRDKVTDALHQLEQSGGQEAVGIIKSKIPTYRSFSS